MYCPPDGNTIQYSDSPGGKPGRITEPKGALFMSDVTLQYAQDMAHHWARSLRRNPRTPQCHRISEEEWVDQALPFYRGLKAVYNGDNEGRGGYDFFPRYAETVRGYGIPLHEGIYSLIMMRRQIWLYTDFQPLFLSDVDKEQMIAIINKTILLFDHGIYVMMKVYERAEGGSTDTEE